MHRCKYYTDGGDGDGGVDGGVTAEVTAEVTATVTAMVTAGPSTPCAAHRRKNPLFITS